MTPGGTAVTLNVLAPDLTITGGFGDVFGSLIKKDPKISPQLSEINSHLVTVAVAPLLIPWRVAPLTQYPKYPSFACAKFLTPALKSLDVGE